TRFEIAARPKSSSPTRPSRRTCAPRRAAATAWLAPLPPPPVRRSRPETVSPGVGRRGTKTTRSVLMEPTTATPGPGVFATANTPSALARHTRRMVGVVRFERTTTCTPYRCATRLRYTPDVPEYSLGP